MPLKPLFTDQAPGGISAKQPPLKGDLKQRLLASVRIMGRHEYEDFSFYNPNTGQENWAETQMGEDRIGTPPDDRPQVMINDKLFEDDPLVTPAYRPKMELAESLHNLKNIEPERYNRMEEAALSDEGYRQWLMESAMLEGVHVDNIPEWHRRSRFDQVIGGWLFAGDDDMPSMRSWSRDDLPFGKPLEAELKKLAKDLDMN